MYVGRVPDDRDPSAPLAVFPFVVGCPRSGTTLLQAMLHAHPELAVPPESHFILRLARGFGDGWHGSAKVGRFADLLFAGRRFAYWRMPRERVVALLEHEQPVDVAAAIRLLYASWSERAGKRRYADKTPRYVTHIESLAALFDEARFIHLIRDGRDVALSLAESFDRGPQTAAQAALYWAARVGAGRSQGLALGPDRYLEIRYEALVSNPDETLRTVCEFIDLPFHVAMLEPRQRAAEIVTGYPDPGVHENLGQSLAMRRDWRRAMPQRELRNFELFAAGLLAELSYPVEMVERGTGACDGERIAVLEREFSGLRDLRFRAARQAARRGERLRRRQSSRWARLGAGLNRYIIGIRPRRRS